MHLEVVSCLRVIRMKKELLFSDKALMSYAQIFLMIFGMFAFGYLFGEYIENDDVLIDYGDQDSLLEVIANWLIDELESNMVSAQVIGEGCCAVTATGNTCQTTLLTECNQDYQSAPTECINTEFCAPGCCISPNTGICNRKTSRVDCEKEGGRFERGEACNLQELQD